MSLETLDYTEREHHSWKDDILEGSILIDIMNDHGLEQLAHYPTREKHIGFNTHFSPWSVSGYPLPGQNLMIMMLFLELWKLSFPL